MKQFEEEAAAGSQQKSDNEDATVMFNITENYIPEHTIQQENQELINYMQELIGMMTTEDEEMNRQNIVMLVDEIYDRLNQ